MKRVLFSSAAKDDRRAITEYTVEYFGIHQARKLRDRFETVFLALLEAPMLGRERSDLDPPGRSFRYFPVMKTFIIVYQPVNEGLQVVRILHGAKNLAFELGQDAKD